MSKNVNWDGNDSTTNTVESQNRVTGLLQNPNFVLEIRNTFNQDRKLVEKVKALNLNISLSYRNRSREARNAQNKKRRERFNDGRAPDTRQQIQNLPPRAQAMASILEYSRSRSNDDNDDFGGADRMIDSPVHSSDSSTATNPGLSISDDIEAEITFNARVDFNTVIRRQCFVEEEEDIEEPPKLSESRLLQMISDGQIETPPRRRQHSINYSMLNNGFEHNGSQDSDYMNVEE